MIPSQPASGARPMKVTVWGINYAPEVTGIAPYNVALCRHLKEHGHEARMVSTFCYYPAWKKLQEDVGRLYRTDMIDGVPVHRCWHYVPAKPNSIKRILHEATYVLFSFLRLLVLPRADVYVVVSPPLLQGFAAWLLTRIKRSRFVFHVQDLQPDAAVGLGMLKPSLLTRALYWLEAFAYKKAALVSGISQGMMQAYRRKGVPPEKTYLFYNGVHLGAEPPRRTGGFRRRNGFASDEFLGIYSGNLGVKQGLGILLDAASLVKNPKVRIVVCGDGADRVKLEERVRAEKLTNVSLLPLQPKEHYAEMLADADASLITQQAGTGGFFFPSKLLSSLAAGKAVVTVADEGSELVMAMKDGDFGHNIPPGSPGALAALLDRLAEDPSGLAALGANGRSYVQRFQFDAVHGAFVERIRQLVR
jgi:colanic acid biosynthesis glycosyl transferase WcaI